MFICKFCEISKTTFFYRTRPVAASVFIPLEIVRKSLEGTEMENWDERCQDIRYVGDLIEAVVRRCFSK